MPLAFRAIVEVLAALRRSGKEHFSAASSSALHRSYWSSEVDWENFPDAAEKSGKTKQTEAGGRSLQRANEKRARTLLPTVVSAKTETTRQCEAPGEYTLRHRGRARWSEPEYGTGTGTGGAPSAKTYPEARGSSTVPGVPPSPPRLNGDDAVPLSVRTAASSRVLLRSVNEPSMRARSGVVSAGINFNHHWDVYSSDEGEASSSRTFSNVLVKITFVPFELSRSDEALIASENLDDLDYKFGICHKERCGRGTIYGIDDFLSVEVDALQKRLQISRARKAGSG
ncbi:hypothetical protein BJV77DRAFT_963549 [Russula vinacea]|nr:hypothetical protein BJV77DRAFT_963549 [Russula vinacea]